jgi:hypothetical protein
MQQLEASTICAFNAICSELSLAPLSCMTGTSMDAGSISSNAPPSQPAERADDAQSESSHTSGTATSTVGPEQLEAMSMYTASERDKFFKGYELGLRDAKSNWALMFPDVRGMKQH